MSAISLVSLVVAEYDEAIDFYVRRVGFELVEDVDLGEGKRWVVVAPAGGSGASLRPAGAQGLVQPWATAGGRVAFFLQGRPFAATHGRMAAASVGFAEAPRTVAYGTSRGSPTSTATAGTSSGRP